MVTVPRLLVAIALVVAAAAAAAAQSLKPQWSRPVGGKTRFVGVEEYGRCSVFVDNGAIQVIAPAGDVLWTWPFRKINKYINPGDVAVSHECDAIALVGDASYKYAWVVQRTGKTSNIPFAATPADIEFDRTGKLVAVGTYAGSIYLYSVTGEQQWKRDTEAAIVNDLAFTDDNQRILFRGWGGAGIVSVAGQVEWSLLASRFRASRDLETLIISNEPSHGPGDPSIAVTDGQRKTLWHRVAPIEAFVSSSGHRILATAGGPRLFSRSGETIATFPDYTWSIALSDDGTHMWLRADDHLACVDVQGTELARIDAEASIRAVTVSRDFSQLLLVREKDLDPVSVERYEVPRPCRPN